eukprot:scaffold78991_cov48-Attheya_sp.AAC.1
MNNTIVSKRRRKESAVEDAEVPTADCSPTAVTLDEKRKCFVLDAFQYVSESRLLRRRWIAAHVFADAINKRYGIVEEEEKITGNEVNSVIMSKNTTTGFGHFIENDKNNHGFFTQKRKVQDYAKEELNDRKGEKTPREKFRFFYVCNKGEFPPVEKMRLDIKSFSLKRISNRRKRCDEEDEENEEDEEDKEDKEE